MSANLDLVRSIVGDWERGDYSSVEWADPEIEFVIADGPTPGSWTGQAAMATQWRAFLDAWEGGIHCEVDECRELDGELASCCTTGAGAGRRADCGSGRCRRMERTCSISVAGG